MRIRRLIIIIVAICCGLFLLPDVAYADNCGSFSDCYNTLQAALAAVVGVGLFAALLSFGLEFVPVVGTGKGIIEAFTGRDLVTGEELAWWERMLGVVPIGGALIGGGVIVAKGIRHADDIGDIARHTDEVGDATRAFDNWIEGLPRKQTPNNTLRDAYEIRHTGPDNIQVRGGGEEIWADGVRSSDGRLLEAKYVEHPGRSPFIPESNVPPFIRDKIVREVEDEFRRYAAVVHDINTPAQGLEVITNDARAVKFFEDLLQKYNIHGRVVIQP